MKAKTSQRQVAAFFDLDLTITNCDSFRYFLKKQYINNCRNWRFVPQVFLWGVLRKLRLISLKTFKEKALICLIQKNETFIQEVGKAFFERHLIKTIRIQAVKKVEWHKDMGHMVFIATSSPDIYVKSVAEHLRCDGYECSKLAYRNDRFIGKLEGNDCIKSEKMWRVIILSTKERIDLKRSYAYSDHVADLPLLEGVGHPIAVSPTRQLRKIALKRGWEIMKI